MMPNADEMVRELHVRTVQFVHKQLSAAKPVSEEAKGGTLEEQIRQLQTAMSADAEVEENVPTIELADQEEVNEESVCV